MRAMTSTIKHLKAVTAVDRHADTRTAALALGDQLAASLGEPPTATMVIASFHHAAALPEAVSSIRSLLGDHPILAATSCGVLADDQEHHSGPTLAAFALCGPGIRARTFRFDHRDGPPQVWSRNLVRSRLRLASPPRLALLLADPFTAGNEAVIRAIENATPDGTPIVGGLVTGGSQPGTNVFVTEHGVLNSGAIGLVLEGDVIASPLVAHAGRAVGPAMVVTASDQNAIRQLNGHPAAEVFDQLLSSLDNRDRTLLAERPVVGIAVEGHRPHQGRGDFLLRPMTTIDRTGGCLLLPGGVPRGSTIRFQVIEPSTAREDLAMALDLASLDDRPVAGILAASSVGRGPGLLGAELHDAARLHARLGQAPLLGFVAAAEIGAIRGRARLAGLGLSAVALRSPTTSHPDPTVAVES